MARLLSEIAADIRRDWKSASIHAEPYISAMACLGNTRDQFGADSGQSVVLYFLCNASTWRGEVARRIKLELKAILKEGGYPI